MRRPSTAREAHAARGLGCGCGLEQTHNERVMMGWQGSIVTWLGRLQLVPT